ncbi:hypothetical protein [Bacillus sp. FJAT-29790]|uniref:hypothetical protein n=1 Tax=Bacillus sp. FJAT-29790 TaxID=1895002 RepID=UPI0020B32683|nr:hypothetical protein [Bacillus sp. FJAT-29790]
MLTGRARTKDEIICACENILIKEKLKNEVNPLMIRVQYIIHEFQTHFLALAKGGMHDKYHWSVLYRNGDTLDEMATLLKNTTPVSIHTEVEYIKQCLVFFTNQVVQAYGKRDSLYIITPTFQELAGLW